MTQPTPGHRRLFVEDGQLKSHPFVVFVTHPITPPMNPRLVLRSKHVITRVTRFETASLAPLNVIPGQYRTVTINGQTVTVPGTLLIFDVSGHDLPWFKSAARFLPSITWHELTANGEPGRVDAIAAEETIYIGHMLGAVCWTLAFLAAVLAMLIRWTALKAAAARRFPARPVLFIVTGPDGYLSLWRTQLVMWTLAVGSVVFLFGLTRLRVPEIPETLVALMGMSVLTGTVSALRAGASGQSRSTVAGPSAPPSPPPAPVLVQPASGGAPAPVTPAVPPTPVTVVPVAAIAFNPGPANWSDLVSTFNKATQQVEVSVPKAQMVFWTVLILVLFVVKSVLLGALWPVPWEMVALTGVSQAGYIGDKLVQSSS
jgi:hypothetical protein